MRPPTLHSALRGLHWPAVPDPVSARMLALQFQFERSQWWPLETLRQQQLRQLRLLLDHARRSVPWYRRALPADVGSDMFDLERFAELPLLGKQQLRQAPDQLLSDAVPPSHGRVSWSATSGSTGDPARVATTELDAWLSQAATLREHLWQGRDFGAGLAVIRYPGEDRYRYPDGEVRDNWGGATRQLIRTGPAFVLSSSSDIADQATWLRQHQPGYLLSYPSNIRALCDYFQDHGDTLPSLRQVRSIGEQVDPPLRELVRATWGVELVDVYSAFEAGYLALQCPAGTHYHVHAEGVLLEVLDDRDRPCEPGQVGRVVVTPLHNFAMPLIRYELGDYAEAGEPCTCGRGLPVLRRVLGRYRNMLRLPDGRLCWPAFGTARFRSIAPIRQFQAVQTEPGQLELRLVTDAPLNAAQEQALVQLVRTQLDYPLAIRFSYHAHIERGPGGKFEEFISRV